MPYEKFINTFIDWDTFLQILLNLELMELSLTKNYYQCSEVCTEPRCIGSGFGEHTINPVKCDEFSHPIVNESITYISRVLNIIEKLYGPERMLRSLDTGIVTANPTVYTLNYNKAFLASQCARLLASKSMEDARMFQRAGQ